MKKKLWELIGYIPDVVLRKYPDMDVERYWSKNDSFLNGYDKNCDIMLFYNCFYMKKKMMVIISNFKWYGYINRQDYYRIPKEQWKKVIVDLNLKIQIVKNYYRIYVMNESINSLYTDDKDNKLLMVDFLKEYNVDFLESDLSNTKRFCIDNEIKISDDFKWIFIDIETDDRLGGVVVGRDRILSFSAIDQDNKEYFFILNEDDDECEVVLLEEIMDFIYKYDIVITWNGKMFDLPYIKERYRLYFGYYPSFKDVAHVDFMNRFRKLFNYDLNIRSWSLEFISNYYLGYGKIKHEEGSYEMWKNNKSLFRKYNMKDSQLLYDLEEKLNVLLLVTKMCQWCGTFPTIFRPSQILDNYILRYANKLGIHFKSHRFGKLSEEESNEEYKGGYLIEPTVGLHHNVYVLDFKSLYPSIIMSWNISFDTFIFNKPDNAEKYIKTVNGFWTMKNRKGVLSSIELDLMKKREKYIDIAKNNNESSMKYISANATQEVIKEMANSMYGIMGQKGCRYYNKNTAEAITLAGHFLIKRTKKLLEDEFGYNVIYGDTDSCLFSTNKIFDIDELLKFLNKKYVEILKDEFNIDDSYVEIEYEKKFKRFIMIQKKNYVGRLIVKDGKNVDEIYGRGLEYVKRDTNEYGRRLQKKLIQMLLYDDLTLPDYVKFVRDEMKIFLNSENVDPKDLIIKTRVSKPISSYKTKTVHVKVAEKMIAESKEFYVGMEIPYIIVGSGKFGLKGIHADDYYDYYDVMYYWDKRIYSLLKRILSRIYLDYDWEQFSVVIIERRKKHYNQYIERLKKCKTDKQKQKVYDMISKNKTLVQRQKDILLGKKKVFRLKSKIEVNV